MIFPREKWFINESEMTDEQLNVKNLSPKNSYVVSGGAGSGKTVLALHRAIELMSRQEDCIMIVYTSALQRFIDVALKYNPFGASSGGVMTYQRWKNGGYRNVAHLIVDEVQDFSREEITHFKSHTSVSMALFGDSAQKLYPEKPIRDADGHETRVKTLSVEEVADFLNLPKRILTNNHRLPKKIARFAQYLSESSESLESKCKKEGDKIPTIIKCNDLAQQINLIIKTINSRGLRDVGILLPDNKQVLAVRDLFLKAGAPCEVKWSHQNSWDNQLNFDTDNPKIMTYYSAKGLQFETTIIPSCNLFNNRISFKALLYVAVTRSSSELIISYSDAMHTYLQSIPDQLYSHLDYTA